MSTFTKGQTSKNSQHRKDEDTGPLPDAAFPGAQHTTTKTCCCSLRGRPARNDRKVNTQSVALFQLPSWILFISRYSSFSPGTLQKIRRTPANSPEPTQASAFREKLRNALNNILRHCGNTHTLTHTLALLHINTHCGSEVFASGRWSFLRQSSGSVTHCSTISLRFGFSMAAATRSLSLICLLISSSVE